MLYFMVDLVLITPYKWKKFIMVAFKNKNYKTSIENNIDSTGPEDIYAGLDTGTYSYKIEESEENQTLFVNEIKRGVIFFVDGSSLIIDDNLAADGFITKFDR